MHSTVVGTIRERATSFILLSKANLECSEVELSIFISNLIKLDHLSLGQTYLMWSSCKSPILVITGVNSQY